MDAQTLYRTGQPVLGGPVLLELRYRVVTLDPHLDPRSIPALVTSDLASLHAVVDFPGTWGWWITAAYRVRAHLRLAVHVLCSRERRVN